MAFESIGFSKQGSLGVLTLQSPATLNALTLEMVQGIEHHLRRSAADPEIAVLVLRGAGEKSFCAGGDVKKVVLAAKSDSNDRYPLDFFVTEYRLDYSIHVYPKPILVLGHGIVMGGGIGLLSGATCRVVTETAQLAMPEIAIGLYPDVGGSYFLSRLPGHLGLYLGLTAARINSADAIALKFADFILQASDFEALLEELLGVPWQDDEATNRLFLKKTLQHFAARAKAVPEMTVLPRQAEIERLIGGKSLTEIAASFSPARNSADPWIATGAQSFLNGCPTSAGIMIEQWKRGKTMSLADCFRMELDLSLNCVKRPNFREGVRARLIDKDQAPHWTPATLAEVSDDWIQEHFRSPWSPESHPFKDLETSVPRPKAPCHSPKAPEGGSGP